MGIVRAYGNPRNRYFHVQTLGPQFGRSRLMCNLTRCATERAPIFSITFAR